MNYWHKGILNHTIPENPVFSAMHTMWNFFPLSNNAMVVTAPNFLILIQVVLHLKGTKYAKRMKKHTFFIPSNSVHDSFFFLNNI